jgi:hypothetical protein
MALRTPQITTRLAAAARAIRVILITRLNCRRTLRLRTHHLK